MDSTATKATVMAKLLGFYTVEIRNLENGNVQAKADLLVMENLFFNQTISKTFDLKGIQGRKVKASSRGDKAVSKTLFDGEWIEGTSCQTRLAGILTADPWLVRSTTRTYTSAPTFQGYSD